jgi:alpha-galactosidase
MLRVADCAYDALTNRIGTVDLRLLHYPVAVHSDMLFWAPSESPVLCAKQLLSILFSVPQISVLLTESTEEQKQLIGDYLAYWTENRETLLHGAFLPRRPDLNYPVIVAESSEKQIAVLYGEHFFRVGSLPCDIFADGADEGILVENASAESKTVELYDRFGAVLLGKEELAPFSIGKFIFPRTGMIRVR